MADMRRRCGNSPHAELTDADRQAVTEFREYLARRRADERLLNLVATTVQRPLTVSEAHQVREAIEALAADRDAARAEVLAQGDVLLRQRDQHDAALAQLAAVQALHQPVDGLGYRPDGSYDTGTVCSSCGTYDEAAVWWPCSTARALGISADSSSTSN